MLGGTKHHPDGCRVRVCVCVHRGEYSQKASAESSQDPSVRVGQGLFLQCFLKKDSSVSGTRALSSLILAPLDSHATVVVIDNIYGTLALSQTFFESFKSHSNSLR